MNKKTYRIVDTKGYLLHATAWSETSSIIQCFTREHGIVSAVAKGIKRPNSALRSALSAFQPLLLSWTGKAEVKTLIGAEYHGIHHIVGKSLMSAWYMNELLLRLLPKEDAHIVLFDAYAYALERLANGTSATKVLRQFEWILLHEAGYGFDEQSPDFNNLDNEPALRKRLHEQINLLLEGNNLRTRKILQALQRY